MGGGWAGVSGGSMRSRAAARRGCRAAPPNQPLHQTRARAAPGAAYAAMSHDRTKTGSAPGLPSAPCEVPIGGDEAQDETKHHGGGIREGSGAEEAWGRQRLEVGLRGSRVVELRRRNAAQS